MVICGVFPRTIRTLREPAGCRSRSCPVLRRGGWNKPGLKREVERVSASRDPTRPADTAERLNFRVGADIPTLPEQG